MGFVHMIPYSKLFHLVGGPAALYLHRAPEKSDQADPENPETQGTFSLAEVVFYDACMRCGRCVQACPSNKKNAPLAPRDFVQITRGGLWQDTLHRAISGF